MDEPGAGWRGGNIGESGPAQLYPSRTGHHLLPPPPPGCATSGPACRRDTEVPAARRAQSQCGQAKSPRPRAPGRTHRAGQKPLRLALGTTGRRDAGLVATHRSSCAPAGGQSGDTRQTLIRAGTLLPESQRAASAPAADSSLSSSSQPSLPPGKKKKEKKKKKSPGQQSLESLC